jgi:hypothetical protein
MSSLYFGPPVFWLFEAGVVQTGYGTSRAEILGQLWKCTVTGTIALNGQNISSPKYNDDVSLLIFHYIISEAILLG